MFGLAVLILLFGPVSGAHFNSGDHRNEAGEDVRQQENREQCRELFAGGQQRKGEIGQPAFMDTSGAAVMAAGQGLEGGGGEAAYLRLRRAGGVDRGAIKTAIRHTAEVIIAGSIDARHRHLPCSRRTRLIVLSLTPCRWASSANVEPSRQEAELKRWLGRTLHGKCGSAVPR